MHLMLTLLNLMHNNSFLKVLPKECFLSHDMIIPKCKMEFNQVEDFTKETLKKKKERNLAVFLGARFYSVYLVRSLDLSQIESNF